jgi:hypothetical protein
MNDYGNPQEYWDIMDGRSPSTAGLSITLDDMQLRILAAERRDLQAKRDEKDRQVAHLYEALDTIARVSNDPASVICAKRALSPEAPLERRVGPHAEE